jgi:hypothetical protein
VVKLRNDVTVVSRLAKIKISEMFDLFGAVLITIRNRALGLMMSSGFLSATARMFSSAICGYLSPPFSDFSSSFICAVRPLCGRAG